VIPGGVNSPVRAFKSVGGDPVYIARGQGTKLYTEDGATLIDFCASWGPLLFGHARPEIVEAVTRAAADGTSFGANTAREVEMAEQLCALAPSMDMVRLVSSGTEAVMTALRIARGATGRNKIIKFDGCYHGHSDSLLVAAGSGLLTGGISSSAGVSAATAQDVYVAPYNDLETVRSIMAAQGSDVAAIIVEPVAGNMGLIEPRAGFLEGLREITARYGTVLIFDEVITGFRLGPTTFGQLIGIKPDLTSLGKIIGGGLPIGAVGGRGELMKQLAPLGPVYQAGTLSGNPVAVAAGLAMLRLIRDENPYPSIARLGVKLAEGLNTVMKKTGMPFHCAQKAGVFTPFFCTGPVWNLTEVKRADTKAYAAFFWHMLKSGFYLAPSQFEVGFVSAVHTEAEIDAFLNAAGEARVEQTVFGAQNRPKRSERPRCDAYSKRKGLESSQNLGK